MDRPDLGVEGGRADHQPDLLRELARPFEVGVGEQEAEFLSAPARDDVRGAQAGANTATQCDQHLVADGVSVAVVDLFEEIDVENDEGERVPMPRGEPEAPLKLGLQMAPVVEAGKHVGYREDLELFAQLLLRCEDPAQLVVSRLELEPEVSLDPHGAAGVERLVPLGRYAPRRREPLEGQLFQQRDLRGASGAGGGKVTERLERLGLDAPGLRRSVGRYRTASLREE